VPDLYFVKPEKSPFMAKLFNAKELKQNASISELLGRLGYQPQRKRGNELFYLSMLRDNDTKPSFTVNDGLGVWYDHGTGKGGNIIDLGIAYWPGLSFKDVVEKIQLETSVLPPQRIRQVRKQTDIKNYALEVIKATGTHPAITSYLKSRGVFEQAKTYLKEVYYNVDLDKGDRKAYFAAGWQNEAGSWEVRNKYFKGCLGKKAISFIPGDHKRVVVFEGYFNFLSWLKMHNVKGESIIILNTLSLLKDGISKAMQFSSIDLFFDRDAAGYRATVDFITALPYASDRSNFYKGFNDYNDKLVDGLKAKRIAAPAEERSKSQHISF
jgi:DNA primase